VTPTAENRSISYGLSYFGHGSTTVTLATTNLHSSHRIEEPRGCRGSLETDLAAFELAEAEDDPAPPPRSTDFVLVGASHGVAMAAALAVRVQTSLKSEFRRIDPASASIVLVDMDLEFSDLFLKTSQSS